MLTLRGERTIADCNVYRDDADPLTVYYISNVPRVARDDAGKPIFSLVVYRRDVSEMSEEDRRRRVGGGLLTFSVELDATDEQLAQIRRDVAADPETERLVTRHLAPGPDGPTEMGRILRSLGLERYDRARVEEALKLTQVPTMGGTVLVAVGGEQSGDEASGGGEFVKTVVGVGQASTVGSHRAAFMVKLSQDGAALVEQMVRADLAALWVGYDLTYRHRLDAVKMTVTADAEKAYEVIQQMWQDLHDSASFSTTRRRRRRTYTYGHDESMSARDILEEVLTQSEVTSVVIDSEAPLEPSVEAELMRIGHEMLKDFLASTFLAYNPEADFEASQQPELKTELAKYGDREYGHHNISYYNLKDWDRSMEASLNHVFESRTVLESSLPVDANLANALGDASPDDHIRRIELGLDFFKYLDVQVLCTANFDSEPVDLVKVHMVYDETGPEGRVQHVEDFAFEKGTPPQRFATFKARPDASTYRYQVTVFYSDSAETFTYEAKTDETILVLDTDTLGLIDVEVTAGLVDWQDIEKILVRLSYGAGPDRQEEELTLSEASDTQRWLAVLGSNRDKPYSYEAVFVDRRGQRITRPAARAEGKRLLIHQPFENEMRVDVVPAGNFKPSGGLLSQVKVALRYEDPANDHVVDDIATLAKQEDSFTWKVPLVDKDKHDYTYQVTAVYVDGVTREDSKRRTDKKILPVGDPFSYAVVINPMLLAIPPGRFALGTIHLVYDDAANGVHAEKTFQIQDFTKNLSWFFRLGSMDNKTYRYRLTLFAQAEDGSIREIALPEQTHDQEVLILKPPPA